MTKGLGDLIMVNLPHITESEWAIMSVLWGESPLTAAEIVKRVQKTQMKPTSSTVKTLLRRLVAKNAVSYKVDETNQRLYYYYPIVEERDCMIKQSEHFRYYYLSNNLEHLLDTFTEEEIESLRKILEQKKNGQ